MSLIGDLIAMIEKEAKKKCWEDSIDDGFIIDDFAGGNIDDAYDGGVESGRVEFARELLAFIKENQ